MALVAQDLGLDLILIQGQEVQNLGQDLQDQGRAAQDQGQGQAVPNLGQAVQGQGKTVVQEVIQILDGRRRNELSVAMVKMKGWTQQ